MRRNNGFFKTVIELFQNVNTNTSPEIIIARASLITHLFKRSKIINSFDLSRGYSLSIFSIPRTLVPQDLIEAHIERKSLRAVDIMMKSKTRQSICNTLLKTWTKVLIYHKSSKQNEPNQTVETTVEFMKEHIFAFRRRQKGPSMNFTRIRKAFPDGRAYQGTHDTGYFRGWWQCEELKIEQNERFHWNS